MIYCPVHVHRLDVTFQYKMSDSRLNTMATIKLEMYITALVPLLGDKPVFYKQVQQSIKELDQWYKRTKTDAVPTIEQLINQLINSAISQRKSQSIQTPLILAECTVLYELLLQWHQDQLDASSSQGPTDNKQPNNNIQPAEKNSNKEPVVHKNDVSNEPRATKVPIVEKKKNTNSVTPPKVIAGDEAKCITSTPVVKAAIPPVYGSLWNGPLWNLFSGANLQLNASCVVETKQPDGFELVKDRAEFQDRLHKLSYGLLQLTRMSPFPWDKDHVVIAGGLVLGAIHKSTLAPETPTDLDFWLLGNEMEQTRKCLEIVQFYKKIADERKVRMFTSHRYGITYLWLDDAPIMIQIIGNLQHKTAADVLAHFDLTYCQHLYDGNFVWSSPEAVQSLFTRKTSVVLNHKGKPAQSRIMQSRLNKAMAKGFTMDQPPSKVHDDTQKTNKINKTVFAESDRTIIDNCKRLAEAYGFPLGQVTEGLPSTVTLPSKGFEAYKKAASPNGSVQHKVVKTTTNGNQITVTIQLTQ